VYGAITLYGVVSGQRWSLGPWSTGLGLGSSVYRLGTSRVPIELIEVGKTVTAGSRFSSTNKLLRSAKHYQPVQSLVQTTR
jgi:hypothetical protein